MNPEVLDLWTRARQALHTATILTNDDPDASVSRSYYAAYYAVSALFAALGQSFHKHSAVEKASRILEAVRTISPGALPH